MLSKAVGKLRRMRTENRLSEVAARRSPVTLTGGFDGVVETDSEWSRFREKGRGGREDDVWTPLLP